MLGKNLLYCLFITTVTQFDELNSIQLRFFSLKDKEIFVTITIMNSYLMILPILVNNKMVVHMTIINTFATSYRQNKSSHNRHFHWFYMYLLIRYVNYIVLMHSSNFIFIYIFIHSTNIIKHLFPQHLIL